MAHQITFTGNLGPGEAVTSLVFTNVTSYNVDPTRKVLSINRSGKIDDVDLTGVTTFTTSISGGNYTITVS
jgi:hypothetical protein